MDEDSDTLDSKSRAMLGQDLQERVVGHLVGGVVDEHVQPPQLADRLLDQRARRRSRRRA